jgi:hypothetical protein
MDPRQPVISAGSWSNDPICDSGSAVSVRAGREPSFLRALLKKLNELTVMGANFYPDF